jgi:DNA-binding response OmpR family regulator
MTHVAIVEDDETLLKSICRFLDRVGASTTRFTDAESFFAAWEPSRFDIVVFDVNLPGQDGFDAAKRLREASPTVGIIMLTARAAADDRATGLLSGADNYLTKPLHLSELQAAVQNLARRVAQCGLAATLPATSPNHGWDLDHGAWTLTAPNGVNVRLTAAEFHILKELMAANGKACDRDSLISVLGKPSSTDIDRRVDNLLSLLRRKVTEETGASLPVKSVRTAGYMFTGKIIDKSLPRN